MTTVATMTVMTVITIVFLDLLPAVGLSYLVHLPQVMHQEEVMLEHFFTCYIFGAFEMLFLTKQLFVPIGLFW